MVRGVTEIEGRGQDALVKEVERMLFTEADGAQELVRPSGHRLTGRAGIGLGHGKLALRKQSTKSIEQVPQPVPVICSPARFSLSIYHY